MWAETTTPGRGGMTGEAGSRKGWFHTTAARIGAGVVLAGLLGLPSARAADETIKLADVVELSGSGASVGTLWRDAAHMAADELNAAGGILGHRIEITDYDTQTNPSVSRA